MRCKKHLADQSSTVGACASCLRERLEVLVEAQAQAEAQSALVVARATAGASSGDLRKPEPNPPPLDFPRSVSPYVSLRKADPHLDRLFHGTPPLVGPNFSTACDGGKTTSSKKRLGKFWILSSLFRSNSNKPEISSRESYDPSSSSAVASPSWFSTILPARRQNHYANDGSIEDSAAIRRRQCQQSDRGISKENFSGEFNGHCQPPSESGCSGEESPQLRHHTPQAVAPPSVRRSLLGNGGKGLSSMAFCLSPLVRASPNRHWSHKGLAQEIGAPVVGGAHQHISTAASFCANRSRKLADFGRVRHKAHNR